MQILISGMFLNFQEKYLTKNFENGNCHFKKLTEVSITFHHTDFWCRGFFFQFGDKEEELKQQRSARISPPQKCDYPEGSCPSSAHPSKARITTARFLYKLLDIKMCKCLLDTGVEYIREPDCEEHVEQSSPSRASVFAFLVFGGRITGFNIYL